MEPFEWNKIIGAVLGSVLAVLILHKVVVVGLHEPGLTALAIDVDVELETHSDAVEDVKKDLPPGGAFGRSQRGQGAPGLRQMQKLPYL